MLSKQEPRVDVPTLAQRRAAIARAAKQRDLSAATEARREYAVASIEEYVRRTVAAAPPLTDEQRLRLAALLRPTSAAGGLDGAA